MNANRHPTGLHEGPHQPALGADRQPRIAEDRALVRPRLSVVIPSYHAGTLACASVERLRCDLADYGESLEVIVVDDGSHDLDAEAVERHGGRLVSLAANRGKGAAVRAGMLEATGDVRLFTDVDLPFGSDCMRVAEYFIARRGFHVVIGDRSLPTSQYALRITPLRRVASAVFTTIVGRVVTGGFFDTQCGMKAFRADVATRLFSLSRVNRFAFDVELVYMSLKHRLDIKRVNVVLERNDTTSVRVVRDSARMLTDLGRIVLNQYRGRYHDDVLLSLITDELRAAEAAANARGCA